MRREDLTKLGLTDEQINQIMTWNGQDIEKQKSSAETVKTELDGLKAQLTEANKQIEAFKGMNIDQIKASADEWKTKAEQAQANAAAQVAQLRFDHALDGALNGVKAKNSKAVRALLNTELLKLAEDGSISGLKEQLEKVKSENDFLFENDQPTPKIIAGANNQSVLTNPFLAAVRKGAGLSEGEK